MARISSNHRWSLIAPGVCAFALGCSAETAPPQTAGGSGGTGPATGGTGQVSGAGGGTNTTPTAGTAGTSTLPTAGTGGTGGTDVLPTAGTGGGVAPGFQNYQLNGMWPELQAAIPTMPATLAFTKQTVHTRFLAESCSIADYNNDGNPDVSSGMRWWEGPAFTVEHVFRDGHGDLPRDGLGPEIDTGVSDDWADFPWDVNGDGFADIINISNCDVDNTAIQFAWEPMSQQRATAYWYQNPGSGWENNPKWAANQISADIRHEHKGLMDVNGDGKPELLGACKGCNPAQTKGYYSMDLANPASAWAYTPITGTIEFPFGGTGWMHGLGFGDATGDGKPDMLDRVGVWEQGADPTQWTLLPVTLYDGDMGGQRGAAHMFAWDIDGDNDQDIFAADWAHGEGLAWYEQTAPGAFTKHMFMGGPGDEGTYGVYFSQPHAAQAVDMDGDGVRDIVTGKMRFAHPNGYGDPDLEGPAEVYVFKTVRDQAGVSGAAHFEPIKVDMEAVGQLTGTGVGRQLSVGHINVDGKVDICTATKLGLYVYLGQ